MSPLYPLNEPIRLMPPSWTVISSSVRGVRHEKEDGVCQDDAYSWIRGDWFFAAVSDGAGSASHSATGSSHLVRTVVEVVRDHASGGTPVSEAEWRPVIESAIQTARETLPVSDLPSASSAKPSANGAQRGASGDARKGRAIDEDDPDDASRPENPLAPFHATLVGAIGHADRGGLFFHIGDGAGIACTVPNWDTELSVSEPENGRYAGETFFYTQPQWRRHLRITPFPANTDLVTLMTDGATPFALNSDGSGLEEPFIRPVTSYLERVEPQAGAQTLAQTLAGEDVSSITSDDITFLWARKTARAS